MKKTFKYRIYPNRKQEQILNKTLSLCRTLYNLALEQRKTAWKQHHISINCYDQIYQLPELKQAFPEFLQVHSQVQQDVLQRLDKAFQAFFRRIKKGEKAGHPRFKGKDRYDSFTYPQFEPKLGSKVCLPKIGYVRIKQHRVVEGSVKTCTVRKDIDQWYVIIVCEIENSVKLKAEVSSAIGIDLGLANLITMSNGERVDNPEYLKKSEERLKVQQRFLSKKKRVSSNRIKQKVTVVRIHRKVRNQRRDFLHKLSRKLVGRFDLIVLEDLNIRSMLKNKNRRLNKSASDAAWNTLVGFCVYKAEEAGSHVIKVDPRNTTKSCSNCGNIIAMPLWQRTYSCPNCGLEMDRDHNAAINIFNRAGSAQINACGVERILSTVKQEAYDI